MPYLGHSPTQAGSFIEVDDFGSSFNGASDTGTDVTAFTLQVGGVDITPNAQNLLVVLDGVVQMSGSAYTVSGSTITFTEAPASGTDLYCLLMGQSASVGQGTVGADELKVSGNGTSGQVLTSDGDGTFSWATDTENYLPLAGGTMSGAINLGSQNITNGGTITGTFVGNITGNVTGNTSGTAATVTGAAQSAITSVGTLTSLNTSGVITQDTNTTSNQLVLKNSNNATAIWIDNNNNSVDSALINIHGYNSSDMSNFMFLHGYDSNAGATKFKVLGDGSAIFAGDVSLSTAGKRLYIPRASDAALTGSLYSRTGNTITLSGAGSSSGQIEFIPSSANSSAVAMTIDSSGNVGIGTSTTTSDSGFGTPVLRIAGSTHPSVVIKSTSSGGEGLMSCGDEVGLQFAMAGNANASHNVIKFRTGTTNGNFNSSEKMRITSSGRIGIGQTDVNAMLDIDDGATGDFNNIGKAQIRVGSINNVGVRAQIGFGWGGSSTYVPVTVGAIGTSGSGYTKADFVINTRAATTDTAPTERLRITTEGDITRGSNDFTSRVFSGYTTGNGGFTVTYPIQDNSSVLVTAMFSHYGAGINSYGCVRMVWVSCRDNSQSLHDINEISSSNGGQWNISTSSSVLSVQKDTGSYAGGGHYWIKIEGSANV